MVRGAVPYPPLLWNRNLGHEEARMGGNSYRRDFIDELKNEPRKVVKSVCLSYEKIFARILKFNRRPEVFF